MEKGKKKRRVDSSQQIILDSIADGVFTVDTNWRITSFNRAAEKITKLSRGEAIGRNCWEVFKGDICERDCALKQTMRSGKTIVNKTIHIVNSKGRRLPISVSTALLKDGNGAISGGVETFRDVSEVEELRRELLDKHTFHDIVTADSGMLRIFEMLPAIARSEETVMLLGDSGTGKELLARAIHDMSNRSSGPFVAVNCGALPDNLLESELFGYRKGAFTDAKSDKPGRFDLAKKGTLFLDELGDITKPMQVKLLRVLQEKCFDPLGSTAPVNADVRIITATNKDMEQLVKRGDFRKDLFYRANVIMLRLPSLARRRGDIPLLTAHFLHALNAIHHKDISGFSNEAMAMLMRYEYPGNIRELKNIVHHAFILCTGSLIDAKHLPDCLFASHAQPEEDTASSVREFEARRIRETLTRNKFNRGLTARELGMHPATLWRKMKKMNIT